MYIRALIPTLILLAAGGAAAQASFGGGQVGQTVPAAGSAPVDQRAQLEETERVWKRLQEGGYVLLMRHGRSDPKPDDAPEGVTIGDCKTQRNLSQSGRDDAILLGTVFKKRNIPVQRVLSSDFCRAQETATLGIASQGVSVTTWDRLSFLPKLKDKQLVQRMPAYTAEVRDLLAAFKGPGNLVIVAHSYNLEPLLEGTPGVGLPEGDFAVLRPGGNGKLDYVGRMWRYGW